MPMMHQNRNESEVKFGSFTILKRVAIKTVTASVSE